MGLFDVVWLKCPNCGASIEFQSKAGYPSMEEFDVDNVPSHVAGYIHDDIEKCKSCGKCFQVKVKCFINLIEVAKNDE